ncbi:MAG: hypothetical protein AAF628_14020 [Planctomycetota bacterium]
MLALLAAGCLALPQNGAAPDPLSGAVAAFWDAPTVAARDALAADLAASGAPFDAVLGALRLGRSYAADAPTGVVLRVRDNADGVRHPYAVVVPTHYTPARAWPVRFDLHGGMGAPAWDEGSGDWTGGWSRADDQIVVLPAGWDASMWWQASQMENALAILREVRATWRIDDDRVVLHGNSDGGAALFFHAMRQPDSWAAYVGWVAPPDRLVRAELRPDGQLHLSNLVGQRFHLVYGGRDRLVPWKHAKRYLELFEASGASIDAHLLPRSDHSLDLKAEHHDRTFAFALGARRDPLPDRIGWATERTQRYARRSWLVIDALDPPGPDHEVDESNLLPRWGTPLQLRGPTVDRVPWGRVELEREGNRVRATARRVERFRLLISPEQFDLTEPIVVTVDGHVRFEGRVEPSVATLLHWVARDDEVTRPFAAEVAIDLGGR